MVPQEKWLQTSVLLFQMKEKLPTNLEARHTETHLFHHTPRDSHRFFSKNEHHKHHSQRTGLQQNIPPASQ